jgi:uncharacterized membrane protein YcaP (DUF421 family)
VQFAPRVSVDVVLHALEIVARVTVIYIAAMVLLRISGRREMSELGPMDLLTMLLVSETVSPALTGEDSSVQGGLLAAATLFALSVLTSKLVFKSRRAEQVISGEAVVLIDRGKVRPDVLNRFRISNDDLRAKLHEHGLLRVDQVLRAYVEADGDITIIKQPEGAQSSK